jgi:hypothetical protein
MNATILSPQSRSSAASVVECCDTEDQTATRIRRSRILRMALTIVCSALIATFLGLGAVRIIVIVADAFHHAINTPTSPLRSGHLDASQPR